MDITAKTAIKRKTASLPCRIAYERDMLRNPLIDWGCGKGADVTWLRNRFYDAKAYDPNFFPLDPAIYQYDVPPIACVLNFYVLNVIEHKHERINLIRQIHDFLPHGGRAIFAVRDWDDVDSCASKGNWQECGDGYRTKTGTFQKGFTNYQLERLIKMGHFDSVEIVNSYPLMALAVKGW